MATLVDDDIDNDNISNINDNVDNGSTHQYKYRFKIDDTPEESAWIVSKLYFLWTNKLFQRAAYLSSKQFQRQQQKEEEGGKTTTATSTNNQALVDDDLIPMASIDRGESIIFKFNDAWNNNKNKNIPINMTSIKTKTNDIVENNNKLNTNNTDAIRKSILNVLGPSFYWAGFIKLINTILQFSFPILLNEILKSIEEGQQQQEQEQLEDNNLNWESSTTTTTTTTTDVVYYYQYRGYILSFLLFVAMGLKAVTENYYFHLIYRGGYRSRIAVSMAVFQKAIRLSNSERQSTTLGELVNLMQIDATKIELFIPQCHVLWDGLIQVIGYMVVLYFLIGWSCFVGLALMVVATPVQAVVMMKLFGLNRLLSKWTDSRVKTINEALQGIQIVKMCTWESQFQSDIMSSRQDELKHLKSVSLMTGFVRAYMSSLPMLVGVVALVTYAFTYSGTTMRASVLFAALTAFDQLRFPLLFYPMALANYSQAKVSAQRIQAFLSMTEIQKQQQQVPPIALAVTAGTTTTTTQTAPAVTPAVPNVQQVQVVGPSYQRINDDTTATMTTSTTTECELSSSLSGIVLSNATVYWSDPTIPIISSSQSTEQITEAASTSLSSYTKNSKSVVSGDIDDNDNNNDDIDSATSESGDGSNNRKSRRSIKFFSTTTTSSGVVKMLQHGGAEEEEQTLIYPKSVLRNVSTRVGHGQLAAIVGRVGSGKSTLCAAILNETVLESGSIQIKGKSIAFAAQTPWILNTTLKQNILFGTKFDETRYKLIIKACQLTHDIDMLDDGDLTEIGERGINLSGGQKQRVSIARAAYSDAQIVILDDPLSALDPEVGGKLFEECILKVMAGKTRFFVTNNNNFLPFCDLVIALKKGEVIEQGTFHELQKRKGGHVNRLMIAKNKKNNNNNKEQQVLSTNSYNTSTITTDLSNTSNLNERESDNSNDNYNDNGKDEGVKIEKLENNRSDTTINSSNNYNTKHNGSVDSSSSSVKKGEIINNKSSAGKSLITDEERKVGAVRSSVYLKYIKAGGGFWNFSVVIIFTLVNTGTTLATSATVSWWTSDANYTKNPIGVYLGVYAFLAILVGVFTFIRTVSLVRFGINASDNLHLNLIHSIFQAPQSFFDTTPIGRILARFSADMYTIDMELSNTMDFVLFCFTQIIVTMGVIVYASPWFGVAIIPLLYLYIMYMNYFRSVSRETKRLESLSRSPIYAQFSETLGGLTTIRAYDQSERFMNEFGGKIDRNTRATYSNKAADRWLSTRLETIGATIAGLAAVLATYTATTKPGTGFASIAGLSISYAIGITSLLNFGVRTFAQMEAAMNSTERVLYYSEEIPQEAPFSSDELLNKVATVVSNRKGRIEATYDNNTTNTVVPSTFAVIEYKGKTSIASKCWPENGSITLNNLKMRYRPETPLVLKGLNVSIEGGERIGIVGRTGSGKSSLFLCLLRLVEPDVADMMIKRDKDTKQQSVDEDDDEEEQLPGSSYVAPVSIDGVDTLRLGLKELRSKITIIPQNPVLFSGTIRSNIDPFDDYADAEVWQALDGCGMKIKIESMPGLLQAEVAEYGENLSAGMRQLLVLGRALLKQCKILLLDEATSSVDFETDREIQRTIRESFKGCTVLTIAHRINTILDSDKILVMKDGLVHEFAPPKELLNDKDSTFSTIVSHAEAEQHQK